MLFIDKLLLTCGLLSSGHSSDSSLKAVYKPPNPPPNMHTLGFCEQKSSFADSIQHMNNNHECMFRQSRMQWK